MKKDFFKNKIHDQFKIDSNDMYSKNANDIISYINDNDIKYIDYINVTSIEQGKFYFMLYNIQGKISKLEKFNPLFALDWIDMDNTKYLYAVSINFLPITVRVMFFNTIFNNNLKVFSDNNLNKQIKSQIPIIGFNLSKAYNMLKSIGFEWAIRKFDIRLINKVACINNNILDKFITMSTYKLTGVDDGKLIDIWKSKLDKQEQREKKFISELIGDYNKMQLEFDSKYLTYNEKNENIENSLKFLKSLGI